MRNKNELIKRYSVFFLGIVTNALGVALITRLCWEPALPPVSLMS